MTTTQTEPVPIGQTEVGSDGDLAAVVPTAPGSDRASYRIAAVAAFVALAALMVGGVAMSLTTRAVTSKTSKASTAATLTAIVDNPWPFLAGGLGLVLVSLFDIFTIPGLHAALGRHGRVLIMVATVAAVIGDLLGIIGRLAQTALVPVALQTAPGNELLGAGHVINVLDATFNTAGFVLVSVSFTCFGLLMLRGFSRRLGWVAIVAGVFTLLGQIPMLAPTFLVANVAYIAWYVGIGRRFTRMAGRDCSAEVRQSVADPT